MPLYEYECQKCGERFEIIQKFSDDPVRAHMEHGGSACDGLVRKLLAAPAIQFKGSGWYVNDYGKGAKKPPAEAGESGDSGAKKEARSSGDSDSSSKTAKPPTKNGSSASTSAAAS